jgi:outer membrane protein assembly factor BamB
VLTDRQAKNVVWKAEMPSWPNGQPTVAGDLVFTTAEPNLLVCVDAYTGRVRWTAAANPWELLGVEAKQAERAQALYDVWR